MEKPNGIDARSWGNIQTLHPKAQEAAILWLQRCRASGLPVVIICGNRTYEEQNELYAQGRTKPGKIVTNAHGGYSNHNFGIAWDFGVFEGVNDRGGVGAYHDESNVYSIAGRMAEAMGLTWGGSWTSIVDEPHIELKTGLTVAQMRERVANGQSVV